MVRFSTMDGFPSLAFPAGCVEGDRGIRSGGNDVRLGPWSSHDAPSGPEELDLAPMNGRKLDGDMMGT